MANSRLQRSINFFIHWLRLALFATLFHSVLSRWDGVSVCVCVCVFFVFYFWCCSIKKKHLPCLKRPSMNHASLNLNESLSLLATRLPCLMLLYLKWFWLRFRLFITPTHPPPPTTPQISVDPNVWVFKSTTCFLMRCQGDTLQEQRTRGREPRLRCWGAAERDFSCRLLSFFS